MSRRLPAETLEACASQAHLEVGRARLKLRAWLAECDGHIAGCTVAQLFDGFHGPPRLEELGYILGAYVCPEHRQQVRQCTLMA